MTQGFVTNWSVQKEIWAHVFRNVLKVDPAHCNLLITEAPFALPSIQVRTMSDFAAAGF